MTTNENSTEKMRGEILADAQREGEEIIVRARRDAEVIVSNATAEADRLRQERLDQAHVEASRRSGLILDTVSVETGRLRAARIEALLESVNEEARQRLLAREGFDYRETIIALASYAINRMAGAEFVVKLSEDGANYPWRRLGRGDCAPCRSVGEHHCFVRRGDYRRRCYY